MWDARLTEPLKIVRLGHADGSASLRIIKQVLFVSSCHNKVEWVREPNLAEYGIKSNCKVYCYCSNVFNKIYSCIIVPYICVLRRLEIQLCAVLDLR